MTKIKSASFTRYSKVLKILQGDPLLRKELSKTMVAVCRPDQSSQDFPQEVVYVVDKIHANNLDANACTAKDIMRFAFDLLVTNKGPIPSYADLAAEEPAPVSVVKKPVAKKKVARTRATPLVVAKPVAPKASVPKAKRTVPKSKATSDAPSRSLP